jgi:hypothetical protein
MSKGVIIHLDDRGQRLAESKSYFEQCGLAADFELVLSETREDFAKAIKDNAENLKCLIFDLWGEISAAEESGEGTAKFLEDIKRSYADHNLPIFIYTGHRDKVPPELQNCGTVFAIDKEEGINVIFEKVKLFHESGFLEVFCPGGILEKQIYRDLHIAFTHQFRSGEDLVNIINSVKSSTGAGTFPERTKRIFKRIAVRSLLSDLVSPEVDGEGGIIEEQLGSVEHYITRINPIDVWTGDIFKKREEAEHIYILTPRCNIIRSSNILYCPFALGETIKVEDKISKMLQGDPLVSGYDRYLPPSPTFKGGKLLISKFNMISKQEILQNYERVITTSDELTNEILGKFGAYFFRTGITPWDPVEAKAQIMKGK